MPADFRRKPEGDRRVRFRIRRWPKNELMRHDWLDGSHRRSQPCATWDAAANDDLLGSLRDANEFVGQPAVLHVTAQRKHGVFVGEAFGAGASANQAAEPARCTACVSLAIRISGAQFRRALTVATH